VKSILCGTLNGNSKSGPDPYPGPAGTRRKHSTATDVAAVQRQKEERNLHDVENRQKLREAL
jgi:hypothetical protein